MLGGENQIPIPKASRAPIEQPNFSDDIETSSTAQESEVISQPLPPPDIIDEFVDENEDNYPCHTITIDNPIPIHPDNAGDFLFDEIVPDIEIEIVEKEGMDYFSGFLGSKNEKLTKTIKEGQSFPTSNLSDFDNFNTSEWIDARNNAWIGSSYFSKANEHSFYSLSY